MAENLITLAVASFIFAITPGPGIIAVLAITINRGTGNGIAMSIGEVTGDMLYLIAVMISLASIASHLDNALSVIRLLGAIYLAYLGYQHFKTTPIPINKAPSSPKNLSMSFAAGFMISITNPKVMVFYLSFLPLFIDLAALNLITAAQVIAVMFISVLMGPLTVVALGHKARHIATNEKNRQIMNRITGLALIAVAIALLATL